MAKLGFLTAALSTPVLSVGCDAAIFRSRPDENGCAAGATGGSAVTARNHTDFDTCVGSAEPYTVKVVDSN